MITIPGSCWVSIWEAAVGDTVGHAVEDALHVQCDELAHKSQVMSLVIVNMHVTPHLRGVERK